MRRYRQSIVIASLFTFGCIEKPMPAPLPPFPPLPLSPSSSSAPGDVFVGNLLLGLQSSEGGAFTLSPDGKAISVLYDNAVLTWLPDEKPKKGALTKRRSGGFVVASRTVPLQGNITVAGFRGGPAKAAPKLTVTIGDKTLDLSPHKDGNFVTCAFIQIPQQQTKIGWSIALDYSDGAQADIHLDTIDIVVAQSPHTLPDRDNCSKS